MYHIINIYIQYILSRCKTKAKVDIHQSTPSLGHPYNAARSYLGKSARSGRSGAASTRPCSPWTWRKSTPTPRDRKDFFYKSSCFFNWNQVPQNRRSNKESCEHWNVKKEERATEPKRWKEENGGMRNLVFLEFFLVFCVAWCWPFYFVCFLMQWSFELQFVPQFVLLSQTQSLT